jgi:hypothetical protein
MATASTATEGPDAPLNYVKACKWFTVARTSLNGVHSQRAQAGYERLCALMTPAQIATATARAKDWQRKLPKPVAVVDNFGVGAVRSRRHGFSSPVAIRSVR